MLIYYVRAMMNKKSFLSALSLGVLATAEAVFFGGNGLRAIGMIAALEQELGRPVLTGNQVVFWYALLTATKSEEQL